MLQKHRETHVAHLNNMNHSQKTEKALVPRTSDASKRQAILADPFAFGDPGAPPTHSGSSFAAVQCAVDIERPWESI